MATAVVSLALGAGVAAVAFYVTRLLLSREELAGVDRVEDGARSGGGEEGTGGGVDDASSP